MVEVTSRTVPRFSFGSGGIGVGNTTRVGVPNGVGAIVDTTVGRGGGVAGRGYGGGVGENTGVRTVLGRSGIAQAFTNR
jgi:hypothetical protein